MLNMFGLVGYFWPLAGTLYTPLLEEIRINNNFFLWTLGSQSSAVSVISCLEFWEPPDTEILSLENAHVK